MVKKSIVENFFREYPTNCDRYQMIGQNEQISKKSPLETIPPGREGTQL